MSATPDPAVPMDAAGHPHDFDVQKRIHRRIRNDPDYDDWEYGTEPLPHEAWVPSPASSGSGGGENSSQA